ncbi:MAG: four helix bundle protein [Planctomycetota bacterium]|nr:four helix bundle protein [Planctomycetota bacterium]
MSETAKQRASETGRTRTTTKVRTFRDLVAWQRGMELAIAVYDHTRSLPEAERYGLVSQMRRAAVSVPSNIAEGYARQSRADYVRFLRVARGSIAELGTQAELAERLTLVAPNPQLRALIDEEARILQALIRALELKEGGV